MVRKTFLLLAFTCTALLVGATLVRGQRPGGAPTRAEAPAWPEKVRNAFFSDAREKLVGERPRFGSAPAPDQGRPSGGPTTPGGGEAAPSGGVYAWSKLISPETLEGEVKGLSQLVDQTVTTPGKFKGGGNRAARLQFSTLAAMFAIIGEYDGDVRWKDVAPGIRDLVAQAGFSCKVGTDQSYNQSKLRKQDLGDLVRGQRPAAAKAADAKAVWNKVADRPPLMQRMELAQQERLKGWLSNSGTFKENSEQVLHEAEIMAALAEVIQREGYDYWDDETYLEYAQQLRSSALEIIDAVKLKNYDAARAAAGEMSKACSECHEGYRA